MTSKLDLPEAVYAWGKAILVTGALTTGIVTIGKKTVSTINAGPEAKIHAEVLEGRVTRLERQSRFLVRGMEKLTRTKYNAQVEANHQDEE